MLTVASRKRKERSKEKRKYNIYIKIYINIILMYIKTNERKIILLDIYKKINRNILKYNRNANMS